MQFGLDTWLNILKNYVQNYKVFEFFSPEGKKKTQKDIIISEINMHPQNITILSL